MGDRGQLPQLEGGVFLTDGGAETTLIFHGGHDLPEFAAFDLLKDEAGTEALRDYFRPYVELARDEGAGFVLEAPTWRASPKWATKIGYSEPELDAFNREAIALMEELRDEYRPEGATWVISGCIGPQDDGYSPETILDAEAAQEYHSTQVRTFADTAADMVSAMTMTYPDEAIGITRAAGDAEIPVAISFTLETDGRLPNGQELGEAIQQVDEATDGAPAYFGINCAHPTHFDEILDPSGEWVKRIAWLRANASTMSHAELDEAEELDDGDPADLAARYAALSEKLPRLSVVGGCCGTDHRHVTAIAEAWPER
jgi:S-methylmethionine-dependent homocysteine/selenocysteine methylase